MKVKQANVYSTFTSASGTWRSKNNNYDYHYCCYLPWCLPQPCHCLASLWSPLLKRDQGTCFLCSCQEPPNRNLRSLTRQEGPRVGRQGISPCGPIARHFLFRRKSATDISSRKATVNKQRAFGSGHSRPELPTTPAWSWLLGRRLSLYSPVLQACSLPNPASPPSAQALPPIIPVLKFPCPASSLGRPQRQKHLSKLITFLLFMCHCTVFKLFYIHMYFDLIKCYWARQGWSYYPPFTLIKK